jgi:hypothetical protein
VRAKLAFAAALLHKFSPPREPEVDGSADVGIIGATLESVRQLAGASLPGEEFWKQCYLESAGRISANG